MSEEERIKRFSYREKRKKLISILSIALIVIAIITATLGALSFAYNKTYYVDYTEKSSVSYGVHLKDNDFYEEDFLGEDYAYIASLIDKVEASFNYGIAMEDAEADFKYTYRIDAVLEIKDRNTQGVVYAPVFTELSEREMSSSGSDVSIKETIFLDYNKYNELAKDFISVYKLRDAQATLLVKMHTNVVSESESFHENEAEKSYVASISVPLATDTLAIKITSSAPSVNQKIMSYTTKDIADTYKGYAIISALLLLILALTLIGYTLLSRNHDITYDIRIKRIVSAYKSFIQKIKNEFDVSSLQALYLTSFTEMLEIRDTIGSPILMYENEDKTATRFYIPTNSSIVYLFEIRVDDYDEIYAQDESRPTSSEGGEPIVEVAPVVEEEPIVEEAPIVEAAPELAPEIQATEVTPTAEANEPIVEEAPVAEEEPIVEAAPVAEEEPIIEEAPVAEEEPIVEEAPVAEEEPIVEEAPAFEEIDAGDTPEAAPSEIMEEIIEHIIELEGNEEGDDAAIAYIDAEGNVVKINCARSFTANLIQSNPEVKYYYNEIKNHILSYKGAKSRISWRIESFNKGRIQLCKLKIRGKTICLYCALDPDDYDRSKYYHERATAKNYAKVPMMIRIKSERGLKRAKALIDAIMAKFSLPPLEGREPIDFAANYPYETTRALVERSLIKILIPGTTAAEPKPHHHEYKKVFKVVEENEVDEIILFELDGITDEDITEIIASPTPSLESIDYDDASEDTTDFEETPQHPGVDVIGVVWPERATRNKIYRYDPDGESVEAGDIVIVPTRDAHRNREVIRKAVVAHANHKVEKDALTHPLKKIIGVMHREKIKEANQD